MSLTRNFFWIESWILVIIYNAQMKKIISLISNRDNSDFGTTVKLNALGLEEVVLV